MMLVKVKSVVVSLIVLINECRRATAIPGWFPWSSSLPRPILIQPFPI